MSDKDAANTVDNARPHPEAAKQLSEQEKKALELGGRIEHEQGQKREDLQKQARELAE